jgi:DnaJ-class molecular chaperone
MAMWWSQVPNDPCALLGVTTDATVAEIGSAYRRAVRRLHPDTRDTDGAADEPTVSIAELQAAREELLRRATRERDEATDDAGGQLRPRRWASTGAAGWTHDGGGRHTDVVVGPVRYHGPSSARFRPH